MEPLKKQVDKTAYRFERYCGEDRFYSYHQQLREIFEAAPKTMLEVGVGDRVVASYIKQNSTIEYRSLDIADDVGADVIGTVTDLPFPDKSFDLVCAFEVLEHIPFEQFDTALSEMARVASKTVLISVPHFGPAVKFLWKMPLLPEIRVAFKLPYARTHEFNGQHYWEIGTKGYPTKRIREHMAAHFTIERDYVPFHNQYHHMFVLTPKRVS